MVIQCVHVHLYIEFIVNNYHIACRTELQRSLRVYVVYHMRYVCQRMLEHRLQVHVALSNALDFRSYTRALK